MRRIRAPDRSVITSRRNGAAAAMKRAIARHARAAKQSFQTSEPDPVADPESEMVMLSERADRGLLQNARLQSPPSELVLGVALVLDGRRDVSIRPRARHSHCFLRAMVMTTCSSDADRHCGWAA
jgi:hypothetical protein